ncbi:MAG: DUF4038 domain-containing protein, partial [Opitutaceae bacterium]|nr:DUF4038 domain-containing protein [Opitutaceae bacterium]
PVDALMIRKQAYWSYFAGGYHTYGNTNVWNFGTYAPEGTQDWKTALLSPGAESLTVLRRFMDSIPWWKLAPSSKVLLRRRIGSTNRMHIALGASDGSGAVVYVSGPDKVTVDLTTIKTAKNAGATWVNPRDGTARAAGEYPTTGEHTFETPSGWSDALLVLDGGIQADRPQRIPQ